jgi:formylglycine-generating enzyme required for sulfatase activity
MFSGKPESYAQHPVPTLNEFEELWATWDNVTTGMVPKDELLNKPIQLRNAIIFYLGHIPTFLDIKLVEALNLEPVEPKYFQTIFERGIDPDVEDPSQCHAHSETPTDWPSVQAILEYQERVRQRVITLYTSGRPFKDQWAGRTLWLAFEHEVMHLETLIYILVQSDRVRPPVGIPRPHFEQLAVQAKKDEVPNEWFDIPAQTLEIGIEDPDNAEGPVRYFGWDVEKPKKVISVPAFKAQGRAITNEEYACYLIVTKNDAIPVSWKNVEAANGYTNGTNGHSNDKSEEEAAFDSFVATKAVRTVYGPIPLKHALSWPVAASYDELDGCAKYLGGRIPTTEEAWSIYEYAERADSILAKTIGKKIPAVNG